MNLSVGTFRECTTLFDVYISLYSWNEVVLFQGLWNEVVRCGITLSPEGTADRLEVAKAFRGVEDK